MSEVNTLIEPLQRTLLERCTDSESYSQLVSGLTVKELKPIYDAFSELILTRTAETSTPISRKQLSDSTVPVKKYQQQAKCKEPLGFCTVSMCIRINPTCATERLKILVRDLRPFLASLLNEYPDILPPLDFVYTPLSAPASAPITPYTAPLPEDVSPTEDTVSDFAPSTPPAPATSLSSSSDPSLSPQVIDPPKLNGSPEFISLPLKDMVEEITDAVPYPPGPDEKIPYSEDYLNKVKSQAGLLWDIVDHEGFEHALIASAWGDILESASTKPIDLLPIARAFSNEIQSLMLQSLTLTLHDIKVITKEYRNSVVGMYSLGNNTFLVGISSTILPGKLHATISKLGLKLKQVLST